MSYEKKHKTLRDMIRLVFRMESMEIQIKGAKEFNRKTILGNEFDIKHLTDELQELELEFNRTKREI